jgi:hypothetical protein
MLEMRGGLARRGSKADDLGAAPPPYSARRSGSAGEVPWSAIVR